MPLTLPTPRAPAGKNAPRQHVRAFKLWQSGQQLAARQQWHQAALAFASADDLSTDALYGLAAAHALIKAGREAQAVERARSLRTRGLECSLGNTIEAHALLALGRNDEAVQCLQAMPAHLARDHEHHKSLALALQRCQRHMDAIPVFFEALASKVDDAYLHFHLGMSFKELGMKAEAAECVRTAITLGVGSSDIAARGQLWFLEREACRWPQAQAESLALRERVQALPQQVAMEASPFTHAVLVDEPLEVRKLAQAHALHVEHGVRGLGALPRRTARAHAGRVRLGYLSADFHTHATAQLLVQMLEAQDRSHFEITLFSTGPDDASPLRRRIAQATEHFVNLRGLSHSAMALRIREHDIDMLVDLKGATYDTLMPVLALRPAPLQLTWLGFPGSSGAPFIDYLIGDPVVTPLAHAAHFTEKIAQLPQCYQPNDSQRERPQADARSDWGVPDDALLLCAFHQPYKISPEVFDAWCGLLQALPQARLWLLHWNTNVENALRAAALERGIASERLHFAPVVPLAQHLARLPCADVYLDAWPCNAHTTAGEALWMGVPVVTLIGATFAQRVAASLLHAVGLPELVCDSVDAYHAKVMALAADAPQRQRLRQYLERGLLQSPLFDGRRRAREMDALLQRIWQRAVAGVPAAHLEAQP